MTENPDVLAGASDPNRPVPSQPDEARQVFPVQFDKDYMDFRPEEVDEYVVAPKGVSALASASELKSLTNQTTTGLEDVSSDDLQLELNLQTSAPPPVGMGT